MKRALIALAAVGATILGAVAPAQAAVDRVAVDQPADVSGFRFWTGSDLCVDGSGINGPYYRVAYIAQQWNLRVGNTGILALNYDDDCIAAGYPPSRRMVIGIVNNPSYTLCQMGVNTTPGVDTDTYNGMERWTHGPAVYINIGQPYCVSSQARRDHQVSSAIGGLLGLQGFDSPAWNSRVMNETDFSLDNVPLPDVYSSQRVREIYSGFYGG